MVLTKMFNMNRNTFLETTFTFSLFCLWRLHNYEYKSNMCLLIIYYSRVFNIKFIILELHLLSPKNHPVKVSLESFDDWAL